MAISRDSKGDKSSSAGPSNKDIALGVVVDLISICAVCAVSYGMSRFLSKYIQQQQLSTRPTNQEAKERLTRMLIEREKELLEEHGESSVDEEHIRERVARKVVTALELNEYESAIAEDVIDPNDITTSFRDVGGIDDIKAELFDLVVLPILRPDLFQSDSGLVSPPRGILLYGAPGTGNHACQGHCQRKWGHICECETKFHHGQMVWRIEQTRLCNIQLGQEVGTECYIH
jgi:ATP-dependent 26S proteasome regulatory subunit